MYYGVAAETPATTAAVQATKGQVLTYAGKIVMAFYYSSSGGRTASSADVFGLSSRTCRRVDDPWDTLSPYHRWKPRSFTAMSLAQAFGLSAPVVDVQVVPTASGRPASVTLVKKTGQSVLLKAADVRARLGLRSTAFRIGVLRVAPPPAARAAGAPGRRLGSRARRRRAAAREARRERRLAALGAGRPGSATAPSPSPCARRPPRPTGSRPRASRARRSPSPFRRDSRSDLEGVGPPRGGQRSCLAAAPAVQRRALCGRVAPAADPAAVAERAPRPRRDACRRSRPDPRARGLGARTPPPSAASRERGTSSRSAPGVSRTSPTTRSCSGSGMPRRTAPSTRGSSPRRFAAVRVAVIDSGIDGEHPELRGRIAAAKSFVSGLRHGRHAGARHVRRRADRRRGRTTASGSPAWRPRRSSSSRRSSGPQRSIPVEAEARRSGGRSRTGRG